MIPSNIPNTPFTSFVWFMGVVEDIADPLKINRVRVRCIGVHTDNKSELPTENLPWAPMVNSTASMSAPLVNQGDWVVGFFIDGNSAQQPIVLGSIHGIPTQESDPSRGFNDPDGVFPRAINMGTNSPLARGELGVSTGVPPQPTSYTPEPTAPVAETTPLSEEETTETKGVRGPLAKCIATGESRGNYGIYNMGQYFKYKSGTLNNSTTTLDEIIRRQNLPTNNPQKIFAFGCYQIIPEVMKDCKQYLKLPGSTLMTADVQDKMFYEYLCKQKRPEVAGFINKSHDDIDKACLALAKEFASVGIPYSVKGLNKDSSYYADGVNRAHTSSDKVKQSLMLERGEQVEDATEIEEKKDEAGNTTSASFPNYKTPSRQGGEDAITYTRRTAAVGIKTASGITWNEPHSKYAAEYPKNHVMETAGGHVLEFDDTVGAERIHIFHKTGSFFEIHPDGKIVIRSNGSTNQITYGDGNFYIRGNCNISATGDMNLLSNKTMNISTMGDVNWRVGGDFNVTSQGDMKLIGHKVYVEGSQLRINEGTKGLEKPEPVEELKTSAQAAEQMVGGEGITSNSADDAEGNNVDLTYEPGEGTGTTPTPGKTPTTVSKDKFSKHFTLAQLVGSATITPKRGYTVQQQIDNLRALAQVILDPLVDAGLKFNINDGYRNGTTGSDHVIGCAVDCGPVGISAYDFAKKAYELVGATSKQFLLEYTTKGKVGWVHIAYNPSGAKSGLRMATFENHGNAGGGKQWNNQFKNLRGTA